MTHRLALIVLVVSCFAACTSGSAELVEVTVDALPCAGIDEGGAWQSVPWFDEATAADCPWTLYPGNTIMRIPHPLGRTPTLVLPYISFSEDGDSAALASGDTAIVNQTAPDHVLIDNRTNQRFYLRLVLE